MFKFDFATLRGDIYGGVTTAVVALPLALAFGVASGAGAIAGLYGAIAVGFFAAVFGGTQVANFRSHRTHDSRHGFGREPLREQSG